MDSDLLSRDAIRLLGHLLVIRSVGDSFTAHLDEHRLHGSFLVHGALLSLSFKSESTDQEMALGGVILHVSSFPGSDEGGR